jgi:hypothetical protein
MTDPIYYVWAAMKQRCLNTKCARYKQYGARGIEVCDRWRDSFAAFKADMGPRPDGHTLERNDNDGHYEPGNCRWATRREQANNRQRTLRIRYEGRVWLVSELAEHVGMSATALDYRIRHRWGLKRALTEPLREQEPEGQVQYAGRMWTQRALADHLGIKLCTIKQRIKDGNALDAPVRKWKRRLTGV